ncbi:MAG: DUF2796 domain-containing protein [Rhodocyclaceae bacterium]
MSRHRWMAVAVAQVMAVVAGNAQAHEAHVHGVGRLDVVVDGNQLTLTLDSPLANVLGFEHPPHTDAEKKAVAAAEARLRQAASLFAPTSEAQCAATSASIESPLADWKNGIVRQTSAHADLEAEYVFTCSQPGRLRGVSVLLFGQFKGFSQIDTQWVAPSGQGGAKLTPKDSTLRW